MSSLTNISLSLKKGKEVDTDVIVMDMIWRSIGSEQIGIYAKLFDSEKLHILNSMKFLAIDKCVKGIETLILRNISFIKHCEILCTKPTKEVTFTLGPGSEYYEYLFISENGSTLHLQCYGLPSEKHAEIVQMFGMDK